MKFKFEMLVPLIPILFFFVMVFISLETHNFNKNDIKVIVLRTNEKFINMTWNNNNMCVNTLDTITNIGYTREYKKGELYSEIKFIPNKK